MTKKHIKRLTAVMRNKLLCRPAIARSEKGIHILWMLSQLNLMKMGNRWDFGKVNRWLGFVQSFFWEHSIYTIDEMRAHVSACAKPFKPCRHPEHVIAMGPITPLVHGHAETQICELCGAYRTLHHGPGPWLEGPVDVSQDDE